MTKTKTKTTTKSKANKAKAARRRGALARAPHGEHDFTVRIVVTRDDDVRVNVTYLVDGETRSSASVQTTAKNVRQIIDGFTAGYKGDQVMGSVSLLERKLLAYVFARDEPSSSASADTATAPGETPTATP